MSTAFVVMNFLNVWSIVWSRDLRISEKLEMCSNSFTIVSIYFVLILNMVTDRFEYELENADLDGDADPVETEAEAAQKLAETLRTIMVGASAGCPWYV